MHYRPNKLNEEAKSSVIVLYEVTSASLILTKRSPHLKNHPSEICFPGGGWQTGDASLWHTALRELKEELGIQEERISLIKPLRLEQTLRGVYIKPWLASIHTLIPYVPNLGEISAVIRVPVYEVQKSENYQLQTLYIDDIEVITCQYLASSEYIWGVTARIMKQLSNPINQTLGIFQKNMRS